MAQQRMHVMYGVLRITPSSTCAQTQIYEIPRTSLHLYPLCRCSHKVQPSFHLPHRTCRAANKMPAAASILKVAFVPCHDDKGTHDITLQCYYTRETYAPSNGRARRIFLPVDLLKRVSGQDGQVQTTSENMKRKHSMSHNKTLDDARRRQRCTARLYRHCALDDRLRDVTTWQVPLKKCRPS